MSIDQAFRSMFAEGAGHPADRWRLLAACLFAFALPLAPTVLPLFLVVLLATQLVDRAPWMHRPLLRPDWRSPAPWLLLYFLWHLAGMLWTSNQGFGWFDIGIKLGMGALALLACLPGARVVGRDAVLISLAVGGALSVLLCLAIALVRFRGPDGAGLEEFLSSRFSIFLHPSYLALYLCVMLATLLVGGTGDRLPRAWRIGLLLLLALGILLSQSRMGWIAMPVVLAWALVSGWRDAWLRRVLLVTFTIGVLGAVALTAMSPGVRARMTDLVNAFSAEGAAAEQSAAIRTVVWRAAWELGMHEAPMGTGTGDVKDELVRSYDAMGADHARDARLNAHNQFLQAFAALGIPGAIALLLAFILPWAAGRTTNVQRLVLLVVALNLAVESMLEVQAGVLFVAFTAWVLWWPAPSSASSRS